MGLKTTRKILSVMLAVIVAVSCVSFSAAIVLGNGFATKNFVIKHIVTDELVKQCDKQLEVKFDALEKKSGIPARVFASVNKSFSTRDSLKQAVEYLFDENDSSLYSESRVDSFYEMCVEYLQGNEYKFDEKNVKNVAKEAAKIYSDTVGIHNADEIKYYIEGSRIACQRVESVSVLAMAICIILIMIMFKTRQDGALYVGAGLIGGGLATVFGALASIIAKLGANYNVAPFAYSASLSSMIRLYLVYVVLVGLVFLLAGIGVFGASIYKMNLEQSRKDSRFSKIVAKL